MPIDINLTAEFWHKHCILMVNKTTFKTCFTIRSVAKKIHYTLSALVFAVIIAVGIHSTTTQAASFVQEPVQACVIHQTDPLSESARKNYSQCLGWQDDPGFAICRGYYQSLEWTLVPEGEVNIQADEASLYSAGRSRLTGNVVVQDSQRIVNAQTAYIYRDSKSNQVNRVELLGNVRYIEPDRLMMARKVVINPLDKSAQIDDVLYRFNIQRASASLPAWGVASYIERFANRDYLLKQATYSTCPPHDRAWQISASKITLDHSEAKGVARNAMLRIHDWPVVYSPYLSFPTSTARKSGFLLPVPGYTNIGGFDLGLPYYWNIAPNYDATIIPHFYSRRGLMLGGDFRYLTPSSVGRLGGHYLPHDRAFRQFIHANQNEFPNLRDASTNRWSFLLQDSRQLLSNLYLNLDFQHVSDDYYLQDFSTNLVVSTQNQILRQGTLTYNSDHWALMGMVQSYQTLHPINQSAISDIYQRLPQLTANGLYNDLPLNSSLEILAQFDNYRWPANTVFRPQGPRFHLNPILSFSETRPWGFITPKVELVENNYNVKFNNGLPNQSFNRTIPRYSLDSGLFFERSIFLRGHGVTQTLEPRLYYLYVPFRNQSTIPVYDSAYMIFNTNQLFRNNRFSGFDRIGDANQLAYALKSRILSDQTGDEKASFSIGQLRYFSTRKVQLCYNPDEPCHDNPRRLGFVSPVAETSPIATRMKYHVSPSWILTGDYVWDTHTKATNNGYLNLHYQPETNRIINFGYTYLVSGDITRIARTKAQYDALNQATLAYSWPFTDRWSSLGVYSYNISKRYGMMSFLGVQYEDCCWAVRLMGGRTFNSISPTDLTPKYNNNVFLQVLLKGLGSAATSDPTSILNSYLPGYYDIFK